MEKLEKFCRRAMAVCLVGMFTPWGVLFGFALAIFFGVWIILQC